MYQVTPSDNWWSNPAQKTPALSHYAVAAAQLKTTDADAFNGLFLLISPLDS